MAQERLVELETGGEINALSEQKLRMTLQQLIVNWAEIEDNSTRRPAVMDVIEETLDEIGKGKLVVVAWFRQSIAYLTKELQKYGAVSISGDTSHTQRDAALQRFKEDPTCRTIVIQPLAGGLGVDGLQHVCTEMLFVEAPTIASQFIQAVARLDREGQNSPVRVQIAVANGTVQNRMFRSLLKNDKEVGAVQGSLADLKDMVYGD